MRFQSLSGSPFVPSSNASTDSRRLLLSSRETCDEHWEIGEMDLVVRRSSIEPSVSVDVVDPRGHGVMASMSSIILD
jgi:hypothetical protein